MLKFLIGPVLTATGYIAGSYYGRDVEQVVHQNPSDTFEAISAAVHNVPASGTTSFEGGTPMPYQLKVEEPGDNRLHLTLTFDGHAGAEAEVAVTPLGTGDQSLIVAHFHGDRAGLRTALAGTDKARLPYAPDWILNLAARPVLQKFAEAIERGEQAPLGVASGDPPGKWEARLTSDQRQQIADWQQYRATQPSVDASQPTGSN